MTFPIRERTYENTQLYFSYRASGYCFLSLSYRVPDERAIAMANRLRCNETRPELDSAYATQHKRSVERALEAKLDEAVLTTKKDHLARVYTRYMDTYKNVRQDLADGATAIFNSEMLSATNARSSLGRRLRKKAVSPSGRITGDEGKRTYYGKTKSPDLSPRAMSQVWIKRYERQQQQTVDSAPRREHAEIVKEKREERRREAAETERKIQERTRRAAAMRSELLKGKRLRVHIDHVWWRRCNLPG